MAVLVTGGAGYIGSHTVIKLLEAGYEVTVADDLRNSSEESLKRVEKITGKNVTFHKTDVCDKEALREIFRNEDITAVIHFAGLKAVGESVQKPLMYYQNNLISTLNLCEVMKEFGCHMLVFSSSATVYGMPETVPIREDFPLSVTNPYGRTKLMQEEMLRDIAAADDTLSVMLLRYFNPIGAHESGLIGEDPKGIPNNLLPYVAQVAVGKLPFVRVFGDDYDTPDGTGVRDYIHVCDLAEGHVLALRKLENSETGVYTYNLGTGKGTSVLELIKAFGETCGKPVPYEITARRDGDVAQLYADPALAEKELGFKAKFTIKEMCEDSWRWQSGNPDGYGK